jgi:predicted nucleic acid-binding protein
VILVDTTVWIDFFNGHDSKQVSRLVHLIEKRDEICICGVILTEILQGIKNSNEYKQVEDLLDSLLFIEMTKDTFILAADIFRSLRLRGITVRKTLNCMIAAIAIEHSATLLHNDRDFDPIEKFCGLHVDKSVKA